MPPRWSGWTRCWSARARWRARRGWRGQRELSAALSLVEDASASGAPPVALAVTVHVDRLSAAEGGTGALLHLPGWVGQASGTGLVATEAALKGVEATFLTEPDTGTGRLRVTGSR